jgi:hypothetical protein
MLDSLVRVSRRAVGCHYASILANAVLSPGGLYCALGLTLPGELRSQSLYPGARTDAGLTGDEYTGQSPAERRREVWPQTLPFQQFHVLFNSLFKVLFIFRSLYLCAIGLWPVFSFRRILPPI